MKKTTNFILPVAIYTLFLAIFSSTSMNAAKSALSLCATSLLPSLFPFFVCSNMLIEFGAANILSKLLSPVMKPLFNLGGACSLPMIMGFISGYPVGAKTAADLYLSGSCSKSEAEKILAFCNNSGPLFVIGALGTGMLNDNSAGLLIYLSHILASIMVAFLFRKIPSSSSFKNENKGKINNNSFGEIFSQSVSSAASLTFTICGFVVIFAILVSFIEKLSIINAISSLGINKNLCKALIYGFIECTGGCSSTILALDSHLLKLMLLSSIVSWSGLSVHLQVLGIIKKAKLSPKLYFKGKALSAIISPVITMFLYGFKSGKFKVLPFIQTVILFLVLIVCITKTFSILKRLYFKYSALPPR